MLTLSKAECIQRVKNKREKMYKLRENQQKIDQAILANKIKTTMMQPSLENIEGRESEEDAFDESPTRQIKRLPYKVLFSLKKNNKFSKTVLKEDHTLRSLLPLLKSLMML